MTVNELIEALKHYPGDMRVLIPGYGGYNDVKLKTEEIVFNFSKAWYYGPHECVRLTDDDKGTDCLIVTRVK